MKATLVSSEIAKRVVNTCLGIKEDDMVWIQTWKHTMDLADSLALECRKAGAVPLVTLMTDALWRETLTKTPEQYLEKTAKHVLSAFDQVTAFIVFAGPEDPMSYRKISGSRLAALGAADKPIYDKVLERNIRGAYIAIGQVTPQRAKTYGIDVLKWRKTMNASLMADYSKIAKFGAKVASVLDRGSHIHLSTKAGTDLAFEIAGRTSHVEDGIVDATDLERRRASTSLPTGIILIAPVETSAEGTVVFDTPRATRGYMTEDLKWVFKEGKVVSVSARTHLAAFKDYFDKGKGDKDRIGSFSLGLNPAAKLIGIDSIDNICLGTASVAIGDNRDIGGKNDSDYGFSDTMRNPTVEVDGKAIMVNGKFTI